MSLRRRTDETLYFLHNDQLLYSPILQQPVTEMDEETVQYDDILMTARPQAGAKRLQAGAATGDSPFNHQYAVLTRETPIYSTLYSYENTSEHNDTGKVSIGLSVVIKLHLLSLI